MKSTRVCMGCIGVVLFALCFAARAGEEPAAEGTPDPREIFRKADAAIKEVDAVRYSAVSTPSGIALNFVQEAKGEAVVVGWNAAWNMPRMFFVHVETSRDGSELELSGGGNGDMFFIIDHTAKMAYEDMDPAVMGTSGNTIQGFGMQEFVHDTPFNDELKAETVEYQGTETVNGEECYKVFVDYGAQQSTWSFSTKDYLPRRRIQHFKFGDQGEGAFAIEITKLEINPEVDDAIFAMKLPDGYELIDDFAP